MPRIPVERPVDPFAILSVVLSSAALLGFCYWPVAWIIAFAGIFTGHLTLRSLRLNGEAKRGRRAAILGCCLGYMALGLIVTMVAVALLLKKT